MGGSWAGTAGAETEQAGPPACLLGRLPGPRADPCPLASPVLKAWGGAQCGGGALGVPCVHVSVCVEGPLGVQESHSQMPTSVPLRVGSDPGVWAVFPLQGPWGAGGRVWASVAEEQGDAPSGFWGLGPRRGRGSRQHRAPRVWHCAPSRERTDVSVTPKGLWWLRHPALEVGKLRRRETESARLSHSPRVAGMLCPLQQLLGWGHGVAEVCGERTCSVPGARRGLLCLSPGLACAGLTSGDQPRGPPC